MTGNKGKKTFATFSTSASAPKFCWDISQQHARGKRGGTQVVNNAMKLIRNAVTLFLMLVLLAIAWVPLRSSNAVDGR